MNINKKNLENSGDSAQFNRNADVALRSLQPLITVMAQELGPQCVMVALYAQVGYMTASVVQTWRHHKQQPVMTAEEFADLAGQVNEKTARYVASLLAEAGVDVVVQEIE